MLQALEALLEFHRIEMWTIVHLFYSADGPKKHLLMFKRESLQRQASILFDMVSSPTKIASSGEPSLKNYMWAVSRCSRCLLEDVEEEAMIAVSNLNVTSLIDTMT